MVQAAVTWFVLHVCPHPPQLEVELCVLTSHPLLASPSQLPKPGLQAMVHVPEEQMGVPEVPLQTVEQVPQWLVSLAVLTSHPLLTRPSQSAQPGLHDAIVHEPPWQPALPFAMEQLLPQLPQ